MRFTTSIALVAAAAVPAALAQSVNIDSATLNQCATTTITFEGSSGPYYVAVIPANDPCTEDAFTEFYDVSGNSVDYYVNQPSGTSVQIYVLDVNGNETWGQIETVGDGDASCVGGGSDAAVASPPSTDTPSSTSTPASSSSPVSLYTPPSPSTTAAALTYSGSGSTNSGSTNSGSTNNDDSDDTGSTTNSDDAPVNAASDDTSGASSITASVTLLVGAFAAVVALF